MLIAWGVNLLSLPPKDCGQSMMLWSLIVYTPLASPSLHVVGEIHFMLLIPVLLNKILFSPFCHFFWQN